MKYYNPEIADHRAKILSTGYVTADMNIPIMMVVDFIVENERNYNKVEEAVQIEAVKACPSVLEYMARPSKEVIEAAIKSNPYNIGRIRKPTKKMQLLAVSLDPGAIDAIHPVCEEAKTLAVILA
jgi:hypothetical protein